jgi:hypothetical protein
MDAKRSFIYGHSNSERAVLNYFIFDASKHDTINGAHDKPEEKKNIKRLLVGKPKGEKNYLVDLGFDGIILK